MGRAKVIPGARFCMDQRRWQKKAHTNWACRFARSDEQGGLGQIHVDSGRTHRPPTRRGWLDPQAAAGPRGPAKSRRRANWLPAGHHPPGPMPPPCPGRRTGPGARLRGPWLRAPPGGRRTNVGAGGPVRLRPRSAHGYTLRGPRFTDSPQGRGPGGSGLGGQPEGAQIYIFHTPTPHPAPRGPPTHLSSQHGT